MRIAHCFNLANDAYNVCKGLRMIGVEADLFILLTHCGSLPHWEDGSVNLPELGDQSFPNLSAFQYDMPQWVHWAQRFPSAQEWAARKLAFRLSRYYPSILPKPHPFRFVRGLRNSQTPRRRQLVAQLPELSKYDLVVGHAPFADLAWFYTEKYGRPYLIYDAGWARYLADPGYHEALEGYKNATKIFLTNVDTYPLFHALGIADDKLVYTPFAIDTSRYAPSNKKEVNGSPTFLMISRPLWEIKGNQRALYSFARYLERKPNARLQLIDWGSIQPDHHRLRTLVGKLGIREHIDWLPFAHKRLLVEYMNRADVIFDQFEKGAFGTAALEAMSCGKPLVSYADPELWTQWHGSVPPIPQARTVDEIYDRLVELEDAEVRERYGRQARDWILGTCSLKVVAERHKRIYEDVLNRS